MPHVRDVFKVVYLLYSAFACISCTRHLVSIRKSCWNMWRAIQKDGIKYLSQYKTKTRGGPRVSFSHRSTAQYLPLSSDSIVSQMNFPNCSMKYFRIPYGPVRLRDDPKRRRASSVRSLSNGRRSSGLTPQRCSDGDTFPQASVFGLASSSMTALRTLISHSFGPNRRSRTKTRTRP